MPTWAHIDIAGVMESHGELPFLDKGMSGVWQCLDACMRAYCGGEPELLML